MRKEAKRTRLTIIAILIVGASLAGCTGRESAPSPVATDTVVIPGAWTFEPAAAQVKAGANVTFENHGGAAHTVTFDDGSFDQTIPPGGAITRAFPAPGTYSYHCKFHPPDMKGTIVVVANTS